MLRLMKWWYNNNFKACHKFIIGDAHKNISSYFYLTNWFFLSCKRCHLFYNIIIANIAFPRCMTFLLWMDDRTLTALKISTLEIISMLIVWELWSYRNVLVIRKKTFIETLFFKNLFWLLSSDVIKILNLNQIEFFGCRTFYWLLICFLLDPSYFIWFNN